MDIQNATTAFAALSQETRLRVFRLLISAGETGMLAGEISQALDVKQNTMSQNLAVLLQAGLIRNMRKGRTIRYFANYGGIRAMMDYLMKDCCAGHPELCAPITQKANC